GPFEAVRLSVEHNIESSGIIFRTLAGLFTGETSVRQLQGPVGIAQLSGEAAQENFIALLSLMAMLSINLGILNLMPVPVLDGGHILIMALEGIARRDFSMQVKEKMLLAGFVVLMMLMVTVIYNDLTRISWLERLMPWRNQPRGWPDESGRSNHECATSCPAASRVSSCFAVVSRIRAADLERDTSRCATFTGQRVPCGSRHLAAAKSGCHARQSTRQRA